MSTDDHAVHSLPQLREKIDDDKEFLKLLYDAAPGAEAAVRMIEKRGWGQDFLENVDPSGLVKVGPFGVTPLMRRALRASPYAFSEDLADLKRRGVHGVDAKDAFGNTAQSINELVASMGYVDIRHLLQVSMERRPFQSSLWNEIVNFPYRESPVSSYEFLDEALRIVFNQHQTNTARCILAAECDK